VKRERQRHIDAFEIWYSSDRSRRTVAERLSVSEQAVAVWISEFKWHARADARDQEAAKQAEKQAIQRRASILAEQAKAGELLRRRGVEYFVKHEVEEGREAIAAIKEGVALERSAEGLPGFVLELMNYDEDQLRAERDRLLRRLPAALDRAAVSGEDEAEPESEGEGGGSDPVLPAHPDDPAGAVP
jgi:transposase